MAGSRGHRRACAVALALAVAVVRFTAARAAEPAGAGALPPAGAPIAVGPDDSSKPPAAEGPPSAAILNPAGAAPAVGTTPSPITDRFGLEAIWTYPRIPTQLRLDPPGTPGGGTSLSGTDDLGYPRRESFGRADLMLRLGERSRIRVDYLDLTRSATTTLSRNIIFGDQTFATGDTVSTALQVRVTAFTYTWAFIQSDRFELGAGGGVYLADWDVRGTDPSNLSQYETSLVGGGPVPAVEVAWRITRQLALTGHAAYFGISIEHATGSLGDYHGDLQYRLHPNLALGAGWSHTRLVVDTGAAGPPGRIGVALNGPELFVRVSF